MINNCFSVITGFVTHRIVKQMYCVPKSENKLLLFGFINPNNIDIAENVCFIKYLLQVTLQLHFALKDIRLVWPN